MSPAASAAAARVVVLSTRMRQPAWAAAMSVADDGAGDGCIACVVGHVELGFR